jgi:hypothetical protein
LMRRFHLLPETESFAFADSWFLKPVQPLLEAMKFFGSVEEALPKFATYRMLRRAGWSPPEAASHVRNYAGTPNIFKRGRQVNVVRAFVPFYNVFVQGLRSDLHRMNPRTSYGWLFRWAMSDGLWAIVTALASAGVFGAALQQLFRGISEYKKTNYNNVPIGWSAGGEYGMRVHFVSFPRSESSRLLSGLIYKIVSLLKGNAPTQFSDLLDFGAGQMPSLNPAIQIPWIWGQYAEGHNPNDPFRGRPILSEAEMKSGGLDSLQPMFKWTWDQSGAGGFFKWDPHAQTTTELLMSAIPGLNRMVQSTDYGFREQQMARENAMDQQREEARLDLPDNVHQLLLEYGRLRGLEMAHRTPQEEGRYNALGVWYNSIYRGAQERITQFEKGKDAKAAEAQRQVLSEMSKSFELPVREQPFAPHAPFSTEGMPTNMFPYTPLEGLKLKPHRRK